MNLSFPAIHTASSDAEKKSYSTQNSNENAGDAAFKEVLKEQGNSETANDSVDKPGADTKPDDAVVKEKLNGGNPDRPLAHSQNSEDFQDAESTPLSSNILPADDSSDLGTSFFAGSLLEQHSVAAVGSRVFALDSKALHIGNLSAEPSVLEISSTDRFDSLSLKMTALQNTHTGLALNNGVLTSEARGLLHTPNTGNVSGLQIPASISVAASGELYQSMAQRQDPLAQITASLKIPLETQPPMPVLTTNGEVSASATSVSETNIKYFLNASATGVSNLEKRFLTENGLLNLTALKGESVDQLRPTSLNILSGTEHGINPISSAASTSLLHPASDAKVQMPVSISFGQAGWGNMVAERAAMMASQSIKFAELQLDPPELGPLQVKVAVNQDQASVSFVATNAQVKDALEQTLMRLKDLLSEQGLDLLDVNVSDQSSQESSEDAEQNAHSGSDGDEESIDNASPTQEVDLRYGVDYYA